jgi:ubiquinone/menaquinone biosynthesis C-methylase UbiE
MTTQTDPEGTEAKYLLRYAGLAQPGSQRVLEVGCGDGRLTWRYANAVGQVLGIDLHADDLRVAVVDRPANLAGRVHFARADALQLPVANRSFDLAIFAWSF